MTTNTTTEPFASLTIAIDSLTISDSKIAPFLVQALTAIKEHNSSLIPHEMGIEWIFSKLAPARIQLRLSDMGSTGNIIWAGNKFYTSLWKNVASNTGFPTAENLRLFYKDGVLDDISLTETQSIDTRFVLVEIDPFGDRLARFAAVIVDDDKPPSGPVKVLHFQPTGWQEIAIDTINRMLKEADIFSGSTLIPRTIKKFPGF